MLLAIKAVESLWNYTPLVWRSSALLDAEFVNLFATQPIVAGNLKPTNFSVTKILNFEEILKFVRCLQEAFKIYCKFSLKDIPRVSSKVGLCMPVNT